MVTICVKLVRSTNFVAYSFGIPKRVEMRLLSLSNSCCHVFPFSAVGGCDGLLSPCRHWWRKERARVGNYRLSPAIHLGQTTRDLGQGNRISRWLQGCSADHHIPRSVQEEVQEGHVEVLLDSPWPVVTVTNASDASRPFNRNREGILVSLFPPSVSVRTIGTSMPLVCCFCSQQAGWTLERIVAIVVHPGKG